MPGFCLWIEQRKQQNTNNKLQINHKIQIKKIKKTNTKNKEQRTKNLKANAWKIIRQLPDSSERLQHNKKWRDNV